MSGVRPTQGCWHSLGRISGSRALMCTAVAEEADGFVGWPSRKSALLLVSGKCQAVAVIGIYA
jgi:hypothetical protein